MKDQFENNSLALQFDGAEIRVVFDESGQPWWVARAVCEILGISKYRDALARMPNDERGSVLLDTLGGPQNLGCVNEPGLYRLIFQSRKPEAEKFKDWVFREVLPSLRRAGAYSVHEDAAARRSAPELPGEEEIATWLAVLREARLTYGPDAARNLWESSPLPAPVLPNENRALLDRWRSFANDCCTLTGDREDRETSLAVRDAALAYWKAQGWELPSPRGMSRGLRVALAGGALGRAKIVKSSTNFVAGLRLKRVH